MLKSLFLDKNLNQIDYLIIFILRDASSIGWVAVAVAVAVVLAVGVAVAVMVAMAVATMVAASEVESKVILMGHPILCCHAPVVRSFFIHCKMIISP